MSLRALAEQRLAIIRETAAETNVKQMKQAGAVFHQRPGCFTPDETLLPHNSANNAERFSVSPSGAGNSETLSGGAVDAPAEWQRGIALLRELQPPAPVQDRWPELITDSERLLNEWGATAAALGWTETDLWGCSPGFARRLDRDGLAMLLRGRQVIAMTESTATIPNPLGIANTYRRVPMPEAVPMWRAAAC
jgi:hypothetical protein